MLSKRVVKTMYPEECTLSERAPPRGRMVHKRKLRLAAATGAPDRGFSPSSELTYCSGGGGASRPSGHPGREGICTAGLTSLFAPGLARLFAPLRDARRLASPLEEPLCPPPGCES